MFIIQPPSETGDESLILFCVDVSGSMSVTSEVRNNRYEYSVIKEILHVYYNLPLKITLIFYSMLMSLGVCQSHLR